MPTRDQLIQQYASVDLALKKLETERDELREKILGTLIKEGTDKLESPFGTFSIGHRKSWKYPASIVKQEEKLKIAQMRAQDKGEATATDTPYLLYHTSIIN